MVETALAGRIEGLIAPALDAMGYVVVRIQLIGSQRRTLQVMAERRDGANMTVDDCAEISRSVSAILDVDDPIRGSYTLEVSSPGIDRPLVRPEDYDRFAGHEAKLELSEPLDGQRKFRGRIEGVGNGCVRLTVNDDAIDLPLGLIARAKLILTDDLIAASQQHSE